MIGTVDQALDELRAGRPVLVVDNPERENEADVVLAAQSATREWVGWTIRHSSGYLCAPMPAARADALDLPLMVPSSQDPRRTAYTVTVDAASGVTTGISAADRSRTLQVLADPASGPADIIRPGHVLPLRSVPGGVLHRAGHTEAAVDLCRLAGLEPVAGIAELVHDDGSMMR
ncbi:MAG: 3,4-dihydroxy-2-butanone-4-phosphate synthase, partial [Micrococcales bacterium]|nr:3,4-dihydroxy-2-butanone-4-phosphate synthase [Micrococcales bacterium]